MDQGLGKGKGERSTSFGLWNGAAYQSSLSGRVSGLVDVPLVEVQCITKSTALGKKVMAFPHTCFFFGFSKRLSFTPVATDNGTAPGEKESMPKYVFVTEFERFWR